MTAHLFGAIWCASSSTYAVRQATKDFPCSNSVQFAIHNNMYVDDLLVSTSALNESVHIAIDCKEVLKKGGFNLTKYVANSPEILRSLSSSDLAPEVKPIPNEVMPNTRNR